MRYVDVKLDHPRRLGYRYGDLKQLSRGLGGLPFFSHDGQDPTKSMLGRLSALDPFALTAFLHAGLQNADKKLTIEQTDDIIGDYLEGGGRPADLVAMIHEGLAEAGLLRTEKGGEDAAANPQTA